jgi:hypothetical protein
MYNLFPGTSVAQWIKDVAMSEYLSRPCFFRCEAYPCGGLKQSEYVFVVMNDDY